MTTIEKTPRVVGGNESFLLPPRLTIQQAADILNISGDYLLHLLENKQLSATQTESELQIRTEDILAYKEERDARRTESLDELSRLS